MFGFGFNLGKSGPRVSNAAMEPSFPAKDFYFADFAGIADATTLRSLDGWSAYNDVALVHASRDRWQVQSGAIARLGGSEDYATAPGKFIVGRSLSSTNHIFRTKMTTKPNDANSLMVVVAGTNENNCVVLTCSSTGGLLALRYRCCLWPGSSVYPKAEYGFAWSLACCAGGGKCVVPTRRVERRSADYKSAASPAMLGGLNLEVGRMRPRRLATPPRPKRGADQ